MLAASTATHNTATGAVEATVRATATSCHPLPELAASLPTQKVLRSPAATHNYSQAALELLQLLLHGYLPVSTCNKVAPNGKNSSRRSRASAANN